MGFNEILVASSRLFNLKIIWVPTQHVFQTTARRSCNGFFYCMWPSFTHYHLFKCPLHPFILNLAEINMLWIKKLSLSSLWNIHFLVHYGKCIVVFNFELALSITELTHWLLNFYSDSQLLCLLVNPQQKRLFRMKRKQVNTLKHICWVPN